MKKKYFNKLYFCKTEHNFFIKIILINIPIKTELKVFKEIIINN